MDEIRDKYLTIRVNEEEKNKITEVRLYRGISTLTQYLRGLIFKDYNSMNREKKK